MTHRCVWISFHHRDIRSIFQVCQRSRRSMAWQSLPWRETTSPWPAWLRAASPLPTCAGSGMRRRLKVCNIWIHWTAYQAFQGEWRHKRKWWFHYRARECLLIFTDIWLSTVSCQAGRLFVSFPYREHDMFLLETKSKVFLITLKWKCNQSPHPPPPPAF